LIGLIVFPSLDIRFLTVFISLATIVGANVTTSRNENMIQLEQRLAQKATADVTKKIGDLQDDVYSLRQLFYKQQEELFSLKTDVSSLKTDVSSLKTDVSSLKTDVSRILEILESRNT
jgi:peptidoglycan hydrolase CwlO-like protein